MSNISDKALQLLNAIMKQAEISCESNTDEQALAVQVLYPNWEDIANGTTLAVGQRVNYLDVLYNVLQEHQKQSTWNPVDSPSLFAKVLIPEPSVIPKWAQPSSTNPYMKGDKVIHNSKTYESLVDNNVWEPGAVGTESLWREIK